MRVAVSFGGFLLEDPLAGPGQGVWVPLWIYICIVVLSGSTSIVFSYFYYLLLNYSRTTLLQLANGNSRKERIEGYLERHNRISRELARGE